MKFLPARRRRRLTGFARRESRRRLETAMPSPSRARIFAHGGGEICQVPKLAKLDAKLLETVFS